MLLIVNVALCKTEVVLDFPLRAATEMTVQYSRAIIDNRDPMPALFRLLFRSTELIF